MVCFAIMYYIISLRFDHTIAGDDLFSAIHRKNCKKATASLLWRMASMMLQTSFLLPCGLLLRVCFSITEAVQKFAGSIPAFVISGLPSPVFSLKYILTGSHDLRPFFVLKCDRFHSINICLVQTAA